MIWHSIVYAYFGLMANADKALRELCEKDASESARPCEYQIARIVRDALSAFGMNTAEKTKSDFSCTFAEKLLELCLRNADGCRARSSRVCSLTEVWFEKSTVDEE